MNSTLALLVATGGIIVAVCAAAQLPGEGERFPASTPVSLGAMVVAGAGMVAWRRATRAEARELHRDGRTPDPLELARNVQQPVSRLAVEASALDGPELRRRVDRILDDFVLPFAAARQTVVQQLGMQRGAELIMGVSLGERLLNRTWTAAADGHLDEARRALRQAEAAFQAITVP